MTTIDDVAPTPLDMDIVRDELLWVITDAITNHPRSLQKRIGPSEIGIPCARRIGYKLAGVEPVNVGRVPWKPTIGTAVHSWLEEVFKTVNTRLGTETSNGPRFLLEHRVNIGEILGEAITGSCDVYDSVTFTVIDWKIVGAEALAKYRANGPGEQYRTQAHAYGRGWTRRGRRVDNVAVFFLPRDRELDKAHFWHERYDEQVAIDALTRVEGIAQLVSAAGPAALPLLPTTEAWCRYCPHFLPASTDIPTACPGHPAAGSNPA